MADKVGCEIHGLDGVEDALCNAPKKMAVKYARNVSKAGGNILKEAIANAAPVDTGFLSEHIGIQSKATGGDEGSLTTHVGPTSQAFYGVFEEFGANGRPGLHFMEHAAERVQDEVVDAFVNECNDRLEDLKR
jgi:HK97 gp10 family phage protein